MEKIKSADGGNSKKRLFKKLEKKKYKFV